MRRLLVGFAGALFTTTLSAAEFGPEVDRAINTCLDAARKQHVGQPTGWDLQWGPGGLAFLVELVAQDNRVYQMRCEAGNIVKEERKAGLKQYEMVSTRHRVEEPEARQTAAAEYNGGELTHMEYDLNWRGNPYYIYKFNLPDGRIATVSVNAVTGKIDRSNSDRKK
ncbi:MAG TPA: PepSY domain-containing protein [Burkholderiales bacterium]|nr:PepSY domain-containing protein [Burkholderiales bacterium]